MSNFTSNKLGCQFCRANLDDLKKQTEEQPACCTIGCSNPRSDSFPRAATMPDENTPLPEFDNLWDYANPAETEREFAEILPSAQRANDASYLAQLLTQIARAGVAGTIQRRARDARSRSTNPDRRSPFGTCPLPA